MRYLLLCVALFGGNAFANDNDEAEAALALATAARKAPVPKIDEPTPEGYEKVSIDGGPWHLRKAPEVALPKGATFRHDGHDCPSCHTISPARTGTWIVRGFNSDGTHTHTCPQCGQSWNH